ncbi:MAG TPA: Crp/Fnr family transcriptional regulator [Roseiarcus sp.]|nr:Crp/Fnr family transcriptional regulator [Roseiarcus sp.]
MRKYLERPNGRIEAAYFPEAGFASVVAVQSNGEQVEVGLIGREGMTGLPIVFGNHRSPHATYIQAPGMGKCILATELRKATQASLSLRDSLLKFVQAFGVQTAHTAVSNAQSRLDARLARWLLMAHDRIGEDTLTLTHEFLSLMLGVRRAGVTEALHALREQGLISYGAWADHRGGSQGNGAQGSRGLWRPRGRIPPPDRVKRRGLRLRRAPETLLQERPHSKGFPVRSVIDNMPMSEIADAAIR